MSPSDLPRIHPTANPIKISTEKKEYLGVTQLKLTCHSIESYVKSKDVEKQMFARHLLQICSFLFHACSTLVKTKSYYVIRPTMSVKANSVNENKKMRPVTQNHISLEQIRRKIQTEKNRNVSVLTANEQESEPADSKQEEKQWDARICRRCCCYCCCQDDRLPMHSTNRMTTSTENKGILSSLSAACGEDCLQRQ